MIWLKSSDSLRRYFYSAKYDNISQSFWSILKKIQNKSGKCVKPLRQVFVIRDYFVEERSVCKWKWLNELKSSYKHIDVHFLVFSEYGAKIWILRLMKLWLTSAT